MGVNIILYEINYLRAYISFKLIVYRSTQNLLFRTLAIKRIDTKVGKTQEFISTNFKFKYFHQKSITEKLHYTPFDLLNSLPFGQVLRTANTVDSMCWLE